MAQAISYHEQQYRLAIAICFWRNCPSRADCVLDINVNPIDLKITDALGYVDKIAEKMLYLQADKCLLDIVEIDQSGTPGPDWIDNEIDSILHQRWHLPPQTLKASSAPHYCTGNRIKDQKIGMCALQWSN